MSEILLCDNFNSALNISNWIMTGDTTSMDNFITQLSNLTNVVNNIGNVPTGTILDYASITPPTNYLNCDGSIISRSTYSNLFSVIGTTYGYSTSNDFKLPNLQGRVSAGYSASNSNLSFAGTIGNIYGEENHTLTTNEIPSHSHTLNLSGNSTGSDTGWIVTAAYDTSSTPYSPIPTTNLTGNSLAHNNTQPTIILNKIIKI